MTSPCPHHPEESSIIMVWPPEPGTLDWEDLEAVLDGRACFIAKHHMDCERGMMTDVGLAVAQGRACCITNHSDECPRALHMAR